MQTHSSSLINSRAALFPQWVSENQLNLSSAYEFSCYNIEAEKMEMLPRGQGEAETLLVHFKTEAAEVQNELYYIYKDK
jgi:hypothetical protein